MHILKGVIWGLIAQIITYLQLQGQLKFQWLKDNLWFNLLMGIPISYMFIQSVRHLVTAFDGEIWPSRLIGFGMGVVVFTLMSYLMFKEPITPKTAVCIGLGVSIILIQIFWK